MFDMHSHILPNVDDGSKDINESIKILEMMKNQGITDVAATPHFYADTDDIQDYIETANNAYSLLLNAIKDKDLPNIYLGSEVLYFRNIGRTKEIKKLTLNNSHFLLLELGDKSIGRELFEDILNLRNNLGIIPIIVHIERYYKDPNYKKLLKFIRENDILSQINSSSLFIDYYSKAAIKLIQNGFVNFIGTDSHSYTTRPPEMEKALKFIEDKFGKECVEGFLLNSKLLLENITENINEEQ